MGKLIRRILSIMLYMALLTFCSTVSVRAENDITEPVAITEPDMITESEAIADPEITAEPEDNAIPELTTEPKDIVEPEIDAEQETADEIETPMMYVEPGVPVEPMGDTGENFYTPYPGATYRLKYSTRNNEYIITGIDGTASGRLVIPSEINGVKVSYIGWGAFADCSGFTGELTIPNSVGKIYDNAFKNCSGFTGDLIIPSSVYSIGSYVFEGCNGLTGNLLLADWGLRDIGEGAFKNCRFTGELVFPEGLQDIGESAFEGCTGFTGELKLPEYLGALDDRTFCGCTGFTGKLIIPNGPYWIGDEVFKDCGTFSSLSIGDLSFRGYSLCYFGTNIFEGCTFNELTLGDCPEEILDQLLAPGRSWRYLTISSESGSIPAEYLKGRQLRAKLVIDSNIKTIGESAFEGCSFSGAPKFGSNVETIGDSAFEGCTFIGALNLSSKIKTIGNRAFKDCTGLTGNTIVHLIQIPNGVETIGESAFEGCSGLEGVLMLGNGVKTIGDSAFKDCINLTGIRIPNSLETIGTAPFEGCSSLTGRLLLGSGVKTIGDSAFKNLSNLTGDLLLPDGLVSIGEGAFEGCSGFSGDLKIPDSVTSVGINAFKDCSGFTGQLTLGKNVMVIKNGTFQNANGFTGDLIIPEKLIEIEDSAFEGCSGFNGDIVMHGNLLTIGGSAFKDCSSFTGDLTISGKVVTIGPSAFEGCSGFNGNLLIPDSVATIDAGAFKDCSGFTGDLTLGSHVITLGENAFTACGFTGDLILRTCDPDVLESLQSSHITWNDLVIADNITVIPPDAFTGMDFNGSLMIGDHVSLIGANAFKNCSGFTGTLTIPDSVTSIGDGALAGCTSLTEIIIPQCVTSIGVSMLPQIRADENQVIDHEHVLKRITNNSSVALTLPATYEYPSAGNYVTDETCRIFWKDESTQSLVTSISDGQTAILIDPNGHNHSFTYTAKGATVTAKCTLDCTLAEGLSITISAPVDLNYDGNAKTAALNDDYNHDAFPGTYEIKYLQGGNPISAENVKLPGYYTAQALIEGQTISVDFKITTDQAEEGIFEEQEEFSHSMILERVYTGKAICPEPVIRWKGMVLTEGRDYTLSYKNNISAASKNAGKKAPIVIVKGCGNYSQTMEIPFDIVKKPLGNGNVYADQISVTVANGTFTGNTVKMKPVVKYGSITLKEGTDYKVSYTPENPKAARRTVTVTIEGCGNYEGSVTAEYMICAGTKDLSKAKVLADDAVYSGAECRPAVAVYLGDELVDASNYEPVYTDNVNAGNGTVTVIGINGYSGSKSAKFKITPKPLNTVGITVAECEYTGKALTPEITVRDGAAVIPASNYTVKYTNNTDAASPERPIIKGNKQLIPTVSVKFKGNYSGTSEKYFSIREYHVARQDLSVTFPDVKESTNELTEDALKPTVKFGKKTLKKGTDYGLVLTDKNGQIQNVRLALIGNYFGIYDYAFRVYTADSDMTAAALTATPEYATTVYDGNKKTPKMTVKTTIGDMQWTLTEGKDYTVTYSNNINARAAGGKQSPTWKVTGKGAYKGSLSGTFEITARELNSDDFAVSVADIKESNGKEVKPKVTVTEKATGKELKSGKDYQIAYANNTAAREDNAEDAPKVTVIGLGNYKTPENADKVLSDTFRIYRKDISGVTVVGLDSMDYTGQQVKPAGFTVYADSKKSEAGRLTENTHYTISYGENTAAGKGTVILKGIGEYGGEKTLKFTILPKWLSWLNALL